MSNSSLKIFVVEDDEWYQKLLNHTLSLNEENVVRTFSQGQDALDALNEKPDVITLDYRLPDFNGSDLLDRILKEHPEGKVIVISEQQDIETAVTLLRKGAYDYLTKSEDIRDRLLHITSKIVESKSLKLKVDRLQDEVQTKYNLGSSIIGNSEKLKKVLKLAEKAAHSNISVMISGETGTGKEVIAKAIHYNSNLKKQPFMPVNMSAIPDNLIESELFGFEKGAFTGANDRRIGKFEQANGGTIFLDEIGEMDIAFQAKLLRVLQENEVTRIGSNQPVKINCRVVVATHRDLLQMMNEGKFREDLYYRLYGLQIDMPPLRERGNDILLLANHFAEQFCNDNNLRKKQLRQDAKRKLLSYSYPGNIRELKSVIELAVVMSDDDEIKEGDLNFSQRNLLGELLSEEKTMKEYELEIIKSFLKKYENDYTTVAQKLGIGKSTIYRLIKKK